MHLSTKRIPTFFESFVNCWKKTNRKVRHGLIRWYSTVVWVVVDVGAVVVDVVVVVVAAAAARILAAVMFVTRILVAAVAVRCF